jgi:hypothetical protein
LIDVYRVYMHPVTIGVGKPFFQGQRLNLKLTDNRRFKSGVVQLTYEPPEATAGAELPYEEALKEDSTDVAVGRHRRQGLDAATSPVDQIVGMLLSLSCH